MAKFKGAKAVTPAEKDFIRIMSNHHGWSFATIARHLNRPKATVYQAYKAMEREGTLHQLFLPGFEPKEEQSE